MVKILETSQVPTKLDKLEPLRGLKRTIRDFVLTPEIAYRLYLKVKYHGGKPRGNPSAPWRNAVLKTRKEADDVLQQLRALGLPIVSAYAKNWDCLAALDCILETTRPDACVLDAGAELYSMILPWLSLYGYKHLTGINLVFGHPLKRGHIRYEYGDITGTRFVDGAFDAITCLSVIEHGVDLRAFYKESARLLKTGGTLITSTDYYCDPIQTEGLMAYGVPVHIFTRAEILNALAIAREYGLELVGDGDIDLDCQEKPVNWDLVHLDYTFAMFTLRKVGAN